MPDCDLIKSKVTNVCNSNVGETWQYQYGTGHDHYTFPECGEMGDSEWDVDRVDSPDLHRLRCDTKPGYEITGDCHCSGCFPAFSPCLEPLTKSIKCTRTKFSGDPKTCCARDMKARSIIKDVTVPYPAVPSKVPDLQYSQIRDMDDVFNVPECYSDSGKKKTCDVVYRDITTDECSKSLVLGNCAEGDIDEVVERWKGSPADFNGDSESKSLCSYALARYLYGLSWLTSETTTDIGNSSPNASYIGSDPGKAKLIFSDFLNNYSKKYSLLASLGAPGYNVLSRKIINVCKSSPWLCEEHLRYICRDYTADDLTADPLKRAVCSCYMTPDNYDKYLKNFEASNISCSPLCNSSDAIPLSNGLSTELCQSSSCIMDDVTINLTRSQGGAINFSQICKACGKDNYDTVQRIKSKVGNTSVLITGEESARETCNCIIHDVKFASMDSEFNNINLSQNCTSQECYRKDKEGIVRRVDCDQEDGTPAPIPPSVLNSDGLRSLRAAKTENNLWFILIAISMLAGLGVIYLIISYKNKKN